MRLSDRVKVTSRFAKSANVERDLSLAALDGYLPTGRALDVVGRVARGLITPSAGRALAITGPHGGGKSSLAVFLNTLFAPRESDEYQAAADILRGADRSTSDLLTQGLHLVDAEGRGGIRAFAAANHEPVAVTVARALHIGARRALGDDQAIVPASFGHEKAARSLGVREIRDAVGALCAVRPVVLVIDEFGKNLEAYASSGGEGDPYLLQWLAEASQGDSALPLVVITMQHLAFDEYAQDTSQARRREWAKVQGRFQDIPYVETPREAWRLISAALDVTPGPLAASVGRWYEGNAGEFAAAGLRDLWAGAQACYPLHPLTVAVLPELCSRYGQNERTLFSFLAGPEPQAVPAFLHETTWDAGGPLPFVGLDRVYDYFLDSSSTMISASATVSRWMEIETRIRDTTGLTSEQLRVLKSIGVLNLVSSAGSLRASRRVLELAATDGGPSSLDDESLTKILASLEADGLITYRDFADEHRIWQGSDFDLEGAVSTARRACQGRGLADLLNEAAPLDPAVAGRHSQRTGVLRIFEQRFSDLRADDLTPRTAGDSWDGSVLYATVDEMPQIPESGGSGKPVVIVIPDSLEEVREVAIEAAALHMALSSAEAGEADWVARRELIERAADADKALRGKIAVAWGPGDSTWHLRGRHKTLSARQGASATLSQVADLVYAATPRVANEMIARRELTSQGAKARRMLLEAFLSNPEREQFGIEGYGPERAIYEAVYRATGLHRLDKKTGRWIITRPKAAHWGKVWAEIEAGFEEAKTGRVSLLEIADRLRRPPIGLKDGILPILLVTALTTHADQIALYEHGSLVLGLDDAVAERLARNPCNFAVKNNGSATDSRRLVVAAIAERLVLTSSKGKPTFLHVVRALFRELQSLPPFTQQTRRYVSSEAAAVRQAFMTAAEPDTLIFETLPALLGNAAFPAASRAARKDADTFAERLGRVIAELRGAYRSLLDEIWEHLAEATAVWGEPEQVQTLLAPQATSLQGRVLEPRLSAFTNALARPLDQDAWVENVAMVVADGQAPRTWNDELAARFALLIADLGGAFRRVQALLYDQLAASGEAYRSRRLTLTRPDGQERSQVLALSDRDRAVVTERLAPVLDQLAELFGSRSAACRTLLAHLATDGEAIGMDETSEDAAKEA